MAAYASSPAVSGPGPIKGRFFVFGTEWSCMADAPQAGECDKGEHELQWDDERGRLECAKCGMPSDKIMDQPEFGT